MKRYHHFGLPAPDQETPIEGEFWLEGGKLWITNPNHHPQRVEWLRYAPGPRVEGYNINSGRWVSIAIYRADAAR